MSRRNVKRNELLMFLFYLLIFFLLDYLNIGYRQMREDYGMWLVLINISINIVMSLLSSYLFTIGSKNIKRAKKMMLATNMSELAILFGILTYGCTPCVISFLAMFSIPFAVVVLPFAGLPYKVVSLLLIVIGTLLVKKESKSSACKIKEED